MYVCMYVDDATAAVAAAAVSCSTLSHVSNLVTSNYRHSYSM